MLPAKTKGTKGYTCSMSDSMRHLIASRHAAASSAPAAAAPERRVRAASKSLLTLLRRCDDQDVDICDEALQTTLLAASVALALRRRVRAAIALEDISDVDAPDPGARARSYCADL